MNVKILKLLILSVGLLLFIAGVWFFFFRSTAQTQTPEGTTGSFNGGGTVSNFVTPGGTSNPDAQSGAASSNSAQKIFKIADGPITAATFIQTFNPTTTVARYVMQDNGHVFDLPVDVPGAVPRPVSNTTIPGIAQAQWAESGSAVLMQYVEGDVLKTVYVGFPLPATSTQATSTQTSAQAPLRIRFLPDNIQALAVSPDGAKIAYLLALNGGGVNGYIANSNGSSGKQLFSLPLSQVRLSWPAPSTILVQSKSAEGVPGIAFSIAVKDGVVVPLLYAPGLTSIADSTFSTVIYQTTNGSADRRTYAHSVASGRDISLSFQPFPEKCVWSISARALMYCATPLAYVGSNYLDLWHQGLASAADSIFAFNVTTGATLLIDTPGRADGGRASDIGQFAVSPEDKYLSFVTKGDRSLWGVRLAQ